MIEADPEAGLPAPRAYSQLARLGEAWVQAEPYWIAYSLSDLPVVLGVFYATADIPGRHTAS